MAKLTIEKAREYGWGQDAGKFMRWRNEVDRLVIQHTGLSVDDLPDWDFASAFMARRTPLSAAKAVVGLACREVGISLKQVWRA